MKTITKLSLAAIAATIITAGAASAGETRWEFRFDAHGNRFLIAVPDMTTTVAAYGDHRGVGQSGAMSDRSEGRWEYRMDAHGNRSLFYVPMK